MKPSILRKLRIRITSENRFIPEHNRLIQAALMTALYFFPFGQSVLPYIPDRLIALNRMSGQSVFLFRLPDSGVLQRRDNLLYLTPEISLKPGLSCSPPLKLLIP
jgi:hypothetical protein